MSEYQRVAWPNFRSSLVKDWKQGEHIAIVGPTGVGKTTLISELVTARRYVVIFVTKIFDPTVSRDFPGFERIEEWPPKLHQEKVLLWPKPGKSIRETYEIQHDVFKKALDSIFLERNWCVIFDEQHYVCQQLKLIPENTMFQHQGRSSGLSVVNGCQRPAWVPLITFSGSTHGFLWRTTFRDDLKRLSDLGGVDKKELEQNMLTLSKHEFVYVNSRSGTTLRSQVER